jgi:Protein of unknown function (DUF1279)
MKRSFVLSLVLAVLLAAGTSEAWAPVFGAATRQTRPLLLPIGTSSTFLQASVDSKEKTAVSAEETTEKFGLEVGLFESLKRKDGGESAKSLLKRYGIAYLATSIPLALLSFILCYILVDNGVDVAGLLSKIGIQGNDTSEKAGTFALAYAAHKAASPIRFPPTVVLTPIVAKLIGKEPVEEETAES